MKPTKRKAFNFLRSYFDVLNQLQTDKDKLDFLIAVINKQFLDENPANLNFAVNLSYESQRHTIESSVKGYKDKMKTDLLGNALIDGDSNPVQGGSIAPLIAPSAAPSVQEKEKEKEKEKKKLTASDDILKQIKPTHSNVFQEWLSYKAEIKDAYKTHIGLKKIITQFNKHSVDCCEWVVNYSIQNEWKGLFWDKYTELSIKPKRPEPKTIRREDFFTQ